MAKIRCVVEHITYINEKSWSVLNVKVKDYKDLITLSGSLLDIPVGSVLHVSGEWRPKLSYLDYQSKYLKYLYHYRIIGRYGTPAARFRKSSLRSRS